MPFGLSRKGFKRKRYADIRKDLSARWKRAFGETSRVDEKSINGIIISLIAYAISPIWMLAENVYNSGFVHKSEGTSLDNLVQNRLMERRSAEKSRGVVEITGDEGTVVGKGFIVAHKVEYETTEDVVVTSSGSALVPIQSVLGGGAGNTPSGTITKIVTPVVGVSGVINLAPTTGGRDEETDLELKERYDRSFSLGGSSTLSGVIAALLGTEGVRGARVQENTTMAEVDGVPAKSIAPFVFGGRDTDVAQSIFDTKAAGIQSFGDVVVTVTDSLSNDHLIGFTRPNEVKLYFIVSLQTDVFFPLNGNEQVRTKIISYVGGKDENAEEFTGLSLGETVIYTKVIAAIQEIPGIVDIPVLKIGVSENPDEATNIPMTIKEVGRTDWEKVAVSNDQV